MPMEIEPELERVLICLKYAGRIFSLTQLIVCRCCIYFTSNFTKYATGGLAGLTGVSSE